MTGNEKSTDPGLSLAERKTLREREAQEAMTVKPLRRRFMRIENAYGKRVWHGRRLRAQ
jgi:hypothetical protein